MAVAFLLLNTGPLIAADACPAGIPLSGGTIITKNGTGNMDGGYHYELWRDGQGGSMTIFNVEAAFKAAWSNSGDFLARVGLKWDETKDYGYYGTIVAEYAFTKTGTGGGYSFIGIYGWSSIQYLHLSAGKQAFD